MAVHPTADGFVDNVSQAYELLTQTADDSEPTDLMGTEYMQVLGMLCSDFSPQASSQLLLSVGRRPYETISLRAFRAGVTTCLLYRDFITQAEALFQGLSLGSSGESMNWCYMWNQHSQLTFFIRL